MSGEQIANMIGCFNGGRSCRVTTSYMEGLEHTVQVTAGTLFEALALGLTSIRTEEWVSGIAEDLNTIKVSVQNVPVEHSVKLKDFNAWLNKEGGTPRERTDRKRIKEILGLPI